MKKPDNSTIFNICAIPNKDVAKQCEQMSQSLNSSATTLTLGGDKFAHMTLYMARFAEKNIQSVIQATKNAIQPLESFDCEHVGYFKTEGRYLEVSYHRSSELIQMQEALIAALAKFRINPGRPYIEGYFYPYSLEQRQNAELTGYDLARKLFRPHITLTRYATGKVPGVFPAFPELKLSFRLSTICIYKANDDGAIFEQLAEFPV
jgi:2'-5' RNA ligase